MQHHEEIEINYKFNSVYISIGGFAVLPPGKEPLDVTCFGQHS
jgi:hypothetical protein